MDNDERARLREEYLDTNYIAENGTDRFLIRIGEPNPALDGFLKMQGHADWVFITAYNPFSRELSDDENLESQDKLLGFLDGKNLIYIKGFGESSSGAWPSEPSVLVIGIDRDSSIELARTYEQNAIVCGSIGQPPELVWCQ